jgi:Tfp pilus assembly protein PilV
MRQGNGSFKRSSVTPLKRTKVTYSNASALQRFNAFALYEVLLGVTIFAVGVLALGRAVENCLNASTLNAEENAVQQILSNRMAEIQAARGVPDQTKEFKINSGYGPVKLIQKSAPAELTEPNKTVLNGINLVTLTAQWERGGASQSRQIRFYVYRPG